MARQYSLKFDVAKAEDLAKRLGTLTGEQIAQTTVPAVNQVLERTYDLARERITVGINLSDEYVRRRFRVKQATDGDPTGVITALGSRDMMTPLSRFGGQMVLAPKVHARSRNKGKLQIPEGQKQKAVQVEVTRGNPSVLLYGFMLPLRGGNGLGVFTRSKEGVRKHRYGPSVYQLFRYQAERIEDDVLADMEATISTMVTQSMKDALE